MSALDKLKINDDAKAELKQFALGLVDKALSYKAVTLRDKSSGKEVDLDVKLYSKFARQFGREKLLDIIEKSLAEQVNVPFGGAKGGVMFQIETRKPDDKLLSEWTSDIGDANKFATQQDAWTQIGELKKLGDEWASAEYRVVEVE